MLKTEEIQIIDVDIKELKPADLIASEIMKRKCRCIEIEPIYAEVIIARWKKLTGKKAVKLQ